MTDDISKVVLKPCPFCGGRAERIDFGPGSGDNEGGSCISCTVCQSSGPVEYGRKENFVSTWNRRLESATTPAEVGPLLDLIGTYWDLAYAEGVQRREHDTKTGEAQRTWSAIEAGIATLARQLAEANGTVLALMARAAGAENASKIWQSRAEQAESQLAEATRRLGEVEGLLQRIVDDPTWRTNDNELWPAIIAALTKEPTK